jgi:hypothetical protein
VTVRDDLEKILNPDNFGLPDVARSIVAGGRGVTGESGHPLPKVGVEETQATLCDFVVAFRMALLELADRIEKFQ